MMRPRPLSLLLFAGGYALHVLMTLAAAGRVPLPLSASIAQGIGLAGLLLAIAAVWRELARLDEVQRGFALTACAVSFGGTALLSYLATLGALPRPIADGSSWAIALLLWLLAFGALQVRARW